MAKKPRTSARSKRKTHREISASSLADVRRLAELGLEISTYDRNGGGLTEFFLWLIVERCQYTLMGAEPRHATIVNGFRLAEELVAKGSPAALNAGTVLLEQAQRRPELRGARGSSFVRRFKAAASAIETAVVESRGLSHDPVPRDGFLELAARVHVRQLPFFERGPAVETLRNLGFLQDFENENPDAPRP